MPTLSETSKNRNRSKDANWVGTVPEKLLLDNSNHDSKQRFSNSVGTVPVIPGLLCSHITMSKSFHVAHFGTRNSSFQPVSINPKISKRIRQIHHHQLIVGDTNCVQISHLIKTGRNRSHELIAFQINHASR